MTATMLSLPVNPRLYPYDDFAALVGSVIENQLVSPDLETLTDHNAWVRCASQSFSRFGARDATFVALALSHLAHFGCLPYLATDELPKTGELFDRSKKADISGCNDCRQADGDVVREIARALRNGLLDAWGSDTAEPSNVAFVYTDVERNFGFPRGMTTFAWGPYTVAIAPIRRGYADAVRWAHADAQREHLRAIFTVYSENSP